MTTPNNDAWRARKAHKILDDLIKGNMVLDEEREFLRNALPELPKQMTLEEILVAVESAARGVTDDYWSPSTNPQDWLWELHAQLKGLKDAPATEPAKPSHSEFLETEADYRDAPEGTIVACEDSPPWHKFDSTWLSTAAYEGNSAKGMTGIIRRVLRWGWGE